MNLRFLFSVMLIVSVSVPAYAVKRCWKPYNGATVGNINSTLSQDFMTMRANVDIPVESGGTITIQAFFSCAPSDGTKCDCFMWHPVVHSGTGCTVPGASSTACITNLKRSANLTTFLNCVREIKEDY